MQSGRHTVRQLIIFRRTSHGVSHTMVHVRQPFCFGRNRTPGHLILGVFAKFSAYLYNTPVRPLTEALILQINRSFAIGSISLTVCAFPAFFLLMPLPPPQHTAVLSKVDDFATFKKVEVHAKNSTF